MVLMTETPTAPPKLSEATRKLMDGHTPGPWDYDGRYDSSCGRPCTENGCHESHFSGVYDIWGPDGFDDGRDEPEMAVVKEADAALIASAPTLLAENKALAAERDKLRGFCQDYLDLFDQSDGDIDSFSPDCEDLYRAIKAAFDADDKGDSS